MVQKVRLLAVVCALAITGAVFVTDQPVIVAVFWFPAVAVAIGVAIFKYRLYDLDLVVSKALVYGLLAVAFTIVYVAIVIGASASLGSLARTMSSWCCRPRRY